MFTDTNTQAVRLHHQCVSFQSKTKREVFHKLHKHRLDPMHDSCNCTLMTLSNYGHRRELCARLHVGSTTVQIVLIKCLHLYKGGRKQHAFNMFRQIPFNVKVFLPCRIESHRPVLLNHVRPRALAIITSIIHWEHKAWSCAQGLLCNTVTCVD